MPDLVVDPVVLREVARRLDGLAGSLPVRSGPAALGGASDALPGSRAAEAAAATARSWSTDSAELRTTAEELATGVADAAAGYERTDADLAERTP